MYLLLYSHSLTGGGSISNSSHFIIRFMENNYTVTPYTKTSQPDTAALRKIDDTLSSDIYFVVRFDSAAKWNAKFSPLYGIGKSGGATLKLPDDLLNDAGGASYFSGNDYASYTHVDQFLTQSEIPGWSGDTFTDSWEWTSSAP